MQLLPALSLEVDDVGMASQTRLGCWTLYSESRRLQGGKDLATSLGWGMGLDWDVGACWGGCTAGGEECRFPIERSKDSVKAGGVAAPSWGSLP